MKKLKNISFIFLILMLSSCGNSESQSNSQPNSQSDNQAVSLQTSKVQLLNKSGAPIYVIKGEKNRLAIEAIINSKKPMMKKILPLFVNKLVIEADGQKTEWMVAKPNYIKSAKKNQSTIYEISKKQNLFKKLKQLSE